MSVTEFGQNKRHSVGLRSGMTYPMTANVIQDVESIKSDDDEEEKTIHSGHFMISRVHESSDDNEDDYEAQSIVQSPIFGGFSFMEASKETCKTYRFGPRSTQTLAIDASLSKLFECMTLAYSGKLTSPKWKQFRGMHVKVKDKIRLNNIIWREWVMQYIYGKLPIVCQFATPLSDRNMHTKPEAIVLEGYYWKRRLDTVTEEYKLWRRFYKDQHTKSHEVRMDFEESGHTELLDRVQQVDSLTTIPKRQHTSSTDLMMNSRDLQDMMDLSDSLISSLKPPLPFDFPIPKELSGFGYADFIQPGLLQLQPQLDDFMDIDQLMSQELNNSRHLVNNAALSMPSISTPPPTKQVVANTAPSQSHIPGPSSNNNSRGGDSSILQMVMSPPGNGAPSPRTAPSNTATSNLLDSLQANISSSPRPSSSGSSLLDSLQASISSSHRPSSSGSSLLDSLQASVASSPRPASSGSSLLDSLQASVASSPRPASSSTSLLDSLHTSASPSPSSTTVSNLLSDSLQAAPSPGGETEMVVDPTIDSENFILNQLQLLKQQRKQQQQQHEKSLQQQLQHQQKILLQEQQKKQQQLQQQKQQQQQQQQKQQQEQQHKQQQQQKQREQISMLLQQNTQLKETLSSGNMSVNQFLEELIKGGQLTVIPASSPAASTSRGKIVETKAIPVKLQESQAIPGKTRDSAAIPMSLCEIPATAVQSRENQPIPGQSRTVAHRLGTGTKSQTVSSAQDSFVLQSGSVLPGYLTSENLNANAANKPKPVTTMKVANTSILSALTSGLAGNITSAQKVVNQKPLQSQASIQRKDLFGFTVPSLPPKGRGKPHRTIAPSPVQPTPPTAAPTPPPSSSLSSQNSYLAQLLTTGTYPGAVTCVSVKQESEPTANAPITSTCNLGGGFTLHTVAPETVNPGPNTITIQPLPVQTGTLQSASVLPTGIMQAGNRPANNFTIQPVSPQAGSQAGNQAAMSQVAPVNIAAVLQSAGVSLTDFPTSILLAAANHAFSPNSLSVKDVLQNVSIQNVIPVGAPAMTSSPVKAPSPVPTTPSAFKMSPLPTSPVMSPASSSFDDSFKSAEDLTVEMMIMDDDDLCDTKRVSHQSAEKRRRTNIKGGFEVLHTLIPSLSQNPSAKVSKAAMLQKTAEYCKKLKSDRSQMQNEADILKQEISSLNQSISICQSQLPATGVPVTRQRADQMKEMFEEYVKQRTLTNWKFWIFSLIIRNLFDSYNNMVSTASVDDLCRTVLSWLDQHCSLVNLRPIAMNAMRHLSTTTSILSDPSRVPEQAAQAVIKRKKDSNTNKS